MADLVGTKYWDVIPYVCEEVSRQGHDTHILDGIERVGWMLDAWSYALERLQRSQWPELHDAVRLGQLVEPHKNTHGIRDCHVRVGSRLCPPPERVAGLLTLLFQRPLKMTPLEFYKEFELIHPFVDGNGRTGKILYNWQLGSLLAPVFPPHDLFGGWIRNP